MQEKNELCCNSIQSIVPHRHFVPINYVWSIYKAGNVSYVNWLQNVANSCNGWFTTIWPCGTDKSFYWEFSIRFLSCCHVKKNLAAFRSICKEGLYEMKDVVFMMYCLILDWCINQFCCILPHILNPRVKQWRLCRFAWFCLTPLFQINVI